MSFAKEFMNVLNDGKEFLIFLNDLYLEEDKFLYVYLKQKFENNNFIKTCPNIKYKYCSNILLDIFSCSFDYYIKEFKCDSIQLYKDNKIVISEYYKPAKYFPNPKLILNHDTTDNKIIESLSTKTVQFGEYGLTIEARFIINNKYKEKKDDEIKFMMFESYDVISKDKVTININIY